MSEPTPEANPLREGLPRTRAPEPCAIVLFGATGDLTHRKLMPALYNLARTGHLPAEAAIVGYARRDWDDETFREEVRKTLEKAVGDGFAEVWSSSSRPGFSSRAAHSTTTKAYGKLKAKLEAIDARHGTQGNRLYYLAVAPVYFSTIVDHLGRAGLVADPHAGRPWSRVVVEKPFGHDLESRPAPSAATCGRRVLDESQTYRIDHYLGKETVQNILALRFGNSMFEPVWNRRHVAQVQITVAESVGMEGGRGAYYDTSGAIRDMVQNHMMQLLCLVAMEPPVDLSADAVRDEKVKVLRALPHWTDEDVAANVVRAQYTAGSIQGRDVAGYLQEKEHRGGFEDARPSSSPSGSRSTPGDGRASPSSSARAKHFLPKPCFQRSPSSSTRPPTALFEADTEGSGGKPTGPPHPTERGASLAFQAQVPGSRRRLQEVRMDFRYGTAFAAPPPEAYERLLLDVMLGDPSPFTRTDEVDNSWRFVDQILGAWERGVSPPVTYPAGTWGPSEADALIERDGFAWRRL